MDSGANAGTAPAGNSTRQHQRGAAPRCFCPECEPPKRSRSNPPGERLRQVASPARPGPTAARRAHRLRAQPGPGHTRCGAGLPHGRGRQDPRPRRGGPWTRPFARDVTAAAQPGLPHTPLPAGRRRETVPAEFAFLEAGVVRRRSRRARGLPLLLHRHRPAAGRGPPRCRGPQPRPPRARRPPAAAASRHRR